MRVTRPALHPVAIRVVLVVLALDAVAVGLHVANGTLDLSWDAVNFEIEASFGTWLSSMQFLVVATCSALAALGFGGRVRRAWLIVAAAFTFFSIDEVAQIHEALADALEESTGTSERLWPVLFAPLGIAVLWAIAAVWRSVRAETGTATPLAAGYIALCASVAIDSAAAGLTGSRFLELLLLTEECGELAGTALLFAVPLSLFLTRFRGTALLVDDYELLGASGERSETTSVPSAR